MKVSRRVFLLVGVLIKLIRGSFFSIVKVREIIKFRIRFIENCIKIVRMEIYVDL